MSQRQNLAEDLDGLVGRIRDGYDPEKIILFGFLARGDTHEWSDIDLIVVKDTDASYGERVKTLTPLTRDRLVGADILVYSQKSTDEPARPPARFFGRPRETGRCFMNGTVEDPQGGEASPTAIYGRPGYCTQATPPKLSRT